MSVSFHHSVDQFQKAKQELTAAQEGLRMHDVQNKALVEDITLRASILRRIDPALINEQRLKTGIRIIDAVINLFYQFNTRIYKKRVQEHLAPYQLALSQLPKDQEKRIGLIHRLYHKTLIKELQISSLAPLTYSLDHRKMIMRRVNAKFCLPGFQVGVNRLSLEQINPNFGKN